MAFMRTRALSFAAAGSVALSAYVLNTQAPIRAAEADKGHIYVING